MSFVSSDKWTIRAHFSNHEICNPFYKKKKFLQYIRMSNLTESLEKLTREELKKLENLKNLEKNTSNRKNRRDSHKNFEQIMHQRIIQSPKY